MNYIINQLFKLTAIPSPSGFTAKASEYVLNEFNNMGFTASMTRKGGVLVNLGGEGNPLVLSAHLDTLGAMVAEIKGNGRLRLLPVGGMQPNNAETENCTIHCRLSDKAYTGTLQMNDPSVHVNHDYASQKREFKEMEVVIDERVFKKEDTVALGISAGDFVCFDPRTVVTDSGFIKSRYKEGLHGSAARNGIIFTPLPVSWCREDAAKEYLDRSR